MATKKFQKKQITPNIVNSITGEGVDNTDPENPIINIVSDKHYVHMQAMPSDVWEYEHGLGKVPAITVTDSANTVMMGRIAINDGVRVRIEFNLPFWGQAYNN